MRARASAKRTVSPIVIQCNHLDAHEFERKVPFEFGRIAHQSDNHQNRRSNPDSTAATHGLCFSKRLHHSHRQRAWLWIKRRHLLCCFLQFPFSNLALLIRIIVALLFATNKVDWIVFEFDAALTKPHKKSQQSQHNNKKNDHKPFPDASRETPSWQRWPLRARVVR